MKVYIYLSIFLAITYISCSDSNYHKGSEIENEEYRVYEELLKPPAIDSLIPLACIRYGQDKWPVFIKDYSIGYSDSDLVRSWLVDQKLIGKDIYTDFVKKNSKSYFINGLDNDNPYFRILKSDSIKSEVYNYWERFYSKHPKAYGIFTLSRVGFNKSVTKALIRLDLRNNYSQGEKIFCCFEKHNNVWKISWVYNEMWVI